jgi:hydrogenase nickel incorporation protein HypA/HybF
VHELAITNEILRTVLRSARHQRAARVHRILLVVSELSDLQPLWLQRYFDRIAAGTPADGARLEVERLAPQFACARCVGVFSVPLGEVDTAACPTCGSRDFHLVAGPDYTVEEIEVS